MPAARDIVRTRRQSRFRTGARQFLKWSLAAFFILAGANHFVHTAFYASIMPPYLPGHTALVYLSGAAEIILGVMLFFRRTEWLAAWGMIALIIAVTPANIQMAIHPELYPAFSPAALWARLPFQGVLIAWAFWFTRPPHARQEKPGLLARVGEA